MSENHDEFLKDIQRQCLTVGSEHVTAMAESLVKLNNELLPTLTFLMKEAHSLKGDFNSVGFLSCSEFIHAFETALTAVEENVKPFGEKLLEEDARVLEFFLSDALQALSSYFGDLLKTLIDKEEYLKVRAYTLETLRTWKPDQRTAAMTNDTAVSTVQSDAKTFVPPASREVSQNPSFAKEPVVVENAASFQSENEMHLVSNDSSRGSAQIVAAGASGSELSEQVQNGDALNGKGDKLSHAEEEEGSPQRHLYLLCQNGNRQFALPIPNVMEIVQSHQWNSLPCIKKDILGMMNLRGEAVPIVNVGSTQPKEWTSSDWVIASSRFVVVCRVSDRVFGIPVEQAEQVIELLPNTFQKASGLAEGSIVRSISMQNQRPILVLEISQVFAA